MGLPFEQAVESLIEKTACENIVGIKENVNTHTTNMERQFILTSKVILTQVMSYTERHTAIRMDVKVVNIYYHL